MDVLHRSEEEGRDVGGVGDDVVSDGDDGDLRARVEREDVAVAPAHREGAVRGEEGDEGVGDGEEDGDVGVGEGADHRGVRVEESNGRDLHGDDLRGDSVRGESGGGGGD